MFVHPADGPGQVAIVPHGETLGDPTVFHPGSPRQINDHVVFDDDPKGESKVFSQVPGKEGRCIKQPDNEKPSGERNTVDLVCFGEDCIHIVNGKVVMRLHAPRRINGPNPLPVTSGPIILQSEGAGIF